MSTIEMSAQGIAPLERPRDSEELGQVLRITLGNLSMRSQMLGILDSSQMIALAEADIALQNGEAITCLERRKLMSYLRTAGLIR